MALVLYAPALALAQVTGINIWTMVISIGIVCTIYTTIGILNPSWLNMIFNSFNLRWNESIDVD